MFTWKIVTSPYDFMSSIPEETCTNDFQYFLVFSFFILSPLYFIKTTSQLHLRLSPSLIIYQKAVLSTLGITAYHMIEQENSHHSHMWEGVFICYIVFWYYIVFIFFFFVFCFTLLLTLHVNLLTKFVFTFLWFVVTFLCLWLYSSSISLCPTFYVYWVYITTWEWFQNMLYVYSVLSRRKGK